MYWKFPALVYYELIIQLIVQYKDPRGLSIYSSLRISTGIFIIYHQHTTITQHCMEARKRLWIVKSNFKALTSLFSKRQLKLKTWIQGNSKGPHRESMDNMNQKSSFSTCYKCIRICRVLSNVKGWKHIFIKYSSVENDDFLFVCKTE